MQKIFISYSRKDTDFVRKLAGDLESAGYDVWWDITDLRGGDDWVSMIPAAIAASQYVIVVLTPNSIESAWVRKEYTQALSLRKKIIPIMLVQCAIPFSLNTINFVNFSIGEYADNFKNLLTPLGYTGEPPVVTPYQKTISLLLPALLKYGIPLVIGVVILLGFVLFPKPAPPQETPTGTSTFTATRPPTETNIPEPSVTSSPTSTGTATVTPTQTTATPSSTKQTFQTLRFCVNVQLDVRNINVRSGPGTVYAVLGEPLDLDSCLTFRALNEEQTWLLIAPNQTNPILQQYEGGWIRRDLLGLGQVGPIDLPVVTLTPTPTPSNTHTITPTFTRTPTFTPSNTPTLTPTSTFSPTPIETDTAAPTDTASS